MSTPKPEIPVTDIGWEISNAGCGELMVSLADLIGWLRVCEEVWEGYTGTPSKVAGKIADDLRDMWLDHEDPRAEDPQ